MRSFTAEDACEAMNARNRELDREFRIEHPNAATDRQVKFIGRLAKKDYEAAGRLILSIGANIGDEHKTGLPTRRRQDVVYLSLDLTKQEASKVIDELLKNR